MMTEAEQVRQFGAKVKRQMAGYYIYEGKNFTVEFNEDACETVWWEVNLYSDNLDPRVEEWFRNWNHFERKCDCVGSLLRLDQELEENK